MRIAIAAAAAIGLLASAGAAQAACTFDAGAGLNTAGKGSAYPGAEGRAWFINAKPIVHASTQYERFGLPREFGPLDFAVLERVGVFDGVMVFAEKGGDKRVLYVPVSAGACTFQPYQRKW